MDKRQTAAPVGQLVKVVNASDEFGRPIVAPPGVAPDRIKILREAFNKAVSDPALLADAEKRRLDMDPSTGDDLDALAKVVEKVRALIGK